MSNKLVCSNITLKLRKNTMSIDNLKMEKGFTYSILGANGSGKTTFLNIILGNRKNKSWNIHGFEETAYVPSDVDVLDFFSRNEIIRIFTNSNQKFDEEVFRNFLFVFKLSGFSQYEELSKGEKKCILLSLALASKPKILILDEISNGVDSLSRSIINDLILDYISDSSNTVIYASNQIEDVMPITDFYLFMDAGKIGEPISTVEITEKFKVVSLTLEEFRQRQDSVYGFDQNVNVVKAIVDREKNDEYSELVELLTILGGGHYV